MTDVAKAAGVSQSTVSMVINNVDGSRLAATTRARVLTVAMELGYRLTRKDPALGSMPHHNSPARNLVAYLVDELSTSVHPVQSVDGARDAAWQHDCLVSGAVTRGNREQQLAALDAWQGAQQIDSGARQRNPVLTSGLHAMFRDGPDRPVQIDFGPTGTAHLTGSGCRDDGELERPRAHAELPAKFD